jgi:hypothetical protein
LVIEFAPGSEMNFWQRNVLHLFRGDPARDHQAQSNYLLRLDGRMLIQHLSGFCIVKVAVRLSHGIVVDNVSNFAGEAEEWRLSLARVVFRSWCGHEGEHVPVRKFVCRHGEVVCEMQKVDVSGERWLLYIGLRRSFPQPGFTHPWARII